MLTSCKQFILEFEPIWKHILDHIQYILDRIGAGLFCGSALVNEYFNIRGVTTEKDLGV